MPRAFCPECAAEVPVDEQGRCFLGHEVPAAASSRPDLGDATEEPEPWVANVTAEDATPPGDEAGTSRPGPPAGAAVGGGEEEAEEEVELDLDTLEQAVAEMGITADEDAEDEDAFAIFDERTPGPPTEAAAQQPQRPVAEEPEPEEPAQPVEPEVEVHEDTVADVVGAQDAPARPGPAPTGPGAEPEVEPAPPEPTPEPEPAQPEPTPAPEPEPAQPETAPPAGEPEPDEWVAFDEPTQAEEPTEVEEEPEPDEEPEPIDTANFLARPKGKRRGLFGR